MTMPQQSAQPALSATKRRIACYNAVANFYYDAAVDMAEVKRFKLCVTHYRLASPVLTIPAARNLPISTGKWQGNTERRSRMRCSRRPSTT